VRKATAPSAGLAGPAPDDVDVHLASTSPTTAGVARDRASHRSLGFAGRSFAAGIRPTPRFAAGTRLKIVGSPRPTPAATQTKSPVVMLRDERLHAALGCPQRLFLQAGRLEIGYAEASYDTGSQPFPTFLTWRSFASSGRTR
jgi:hypothetical protein